VRPLVDVGLALDRTSFADLDLSRGGTDVSRLREIALYAAGALPGRFASRGLHMTID